MIKDKLELQYTVRFTWVIYKENVIKLSKLIVAVSAYSATSIMDWFETDLHALFLFLFDKFLLSVDGRVTFISYDGNQWSVSSN